MRASPKLIKRRKGFSEIAELNLRHFKCFESLRLPLRPLTLLSGGNASGKSTIIQAFALLHQTMSENERSHGLILNGAALSLGTVADVIDQTHGRQECEIGLLDNWDSLHWTFTGEREDIVMRVSSVSVNGRASVKPAVLRNLLPQPASENNCARRIRELTYLCARRVGPQDTYELKRPAGIRAVGSKGEHAASVLFAERDRKLTSALVKADLSPTLLRQTEARMGQFFPGCRLEVVRVPRTNCAALGLRTETDTGFRRPVHAGFGLTQAFPIVVAALSAKAGDLLLIENPELCMHPSGQAAMGEFLAEAAASGVQVILETHSDHVLNGIRRAVKKSVLSSGDAVFHFFTPREKAAAAGLPQVECLAINSAGAFDRWPDGFFDQADHDMNCLAGWS